MAYLGLAAGLAILGLTLLAFMYRAQAQQAKAGYDRALADDAEARAAAAEERLRLMGSGTALAINFRQYREAVEGWIATHHPELGDEFFDVCLRYASAATGAAGAAVPERSAAEAGAEPKPG